MDMYDLVDCAECEHYKRIHGRTWGDPYYCYPDEDICNIDVSSINPCERMLDSLEEKITRGDLETKKGLFVDSTQLKDEDAKKNFYDESGLDCFRYDFSSAPYWLIRLDGKEPIPYRNLEEVFKEVA